MRPPSALKIAACALGATALIAAGCGSEGTVSPLPNTVIGSLPKPTPVGKGNPTAGKAVFTSAGCGACHTYALAASNGKVGPDLDHLAADAQKANQGTLAEYVQNSITDPNAYVVPGYSAGIMPGSYGQSLKPQQIADLVAFLTQKSG
jgi:mono/diheme cytochrome c family protein